MAYRPIQALGAAADLDFSELRGLERLWLDRREALDRAGSLGPYLVRLRRDWAIETGLIERLYTWDRGVTELLIERGIDAVLITHHAGLTERDAAHARDLIGDQESVIEGLFAFVKERTALTETYVRQVHEAFTRNQESCIGLDQEGRRVVVPLLRGEYKRHPNNRRRPDGGMHEYCPPLEVGAEMHRLVEWYNDAPDGVAPETLAAWLHHRFTQIHPFQDGNGRVARALATLVLIKRGLFPLVVRNDVRDEYIDAPEKADAGSLRLLVRFFGRLQCDTILKALAARGRETDEVVLEHILESARQALDAERPRPPVSEVVSRLARGLFSAAHLRLKELQDQVNAKIDGDAAGTYGASRLAGGFTGRLAPDVERISGSLGYEAEIAPFHGWTGLRILTTHPFALVLDIHGYGRRFPGVMAALALFSASAELFTRTPNAFPSDLHPLQRTPFQFNYADDEAALSTRFGEWLEEVILLAMAEWRRSLG